MTNPQKSDARFEGIEHETSNRGDIDKNKGVNHLPEEVGKHLQLPTASTEVESIPSICSNVVQVSTATRHMVRSEGAVHLLRPFPNSHRRRARRTRGPLRRLSL